MVDYLDNKRLTLAFLLARCETVIVTLKYFNGDEEGCEDNVHRECYHLRPRVVRNVGGGWCLVGTVMGP